MNIVYLVVLGSVVLVSTALAQSKPYKSVCLDIEPAGDEVLLTVCNHEHGMVSKPQPRLYLRVYADGRTEVEVTNTAESEPYGNYTLKKKQFRVTAEEMDEIRRLGTAPDFQAAKESYPAYVIGTDSSLSTTVCFHGTGGTKKISVVNYSPVNIENGEHYGKSFCKLMARVELYRDRAIGVVREPPSITYCDLIRNREWYLDSQVAINADLESTSDGLSVSDPDCDVRTLSGGPRGVRAILGKADAVHKKAQAISRERFGGRARVYIYGKLRSSGGATPAEYRFEIIEILTMEPNYSPFKGRLEAGHMYSDTVEFVARKKFSLSQSLRQLPHTAAAIEWTNLDAYPALSRFGQKYVTFRVLAADTVRMGTNRWNTTYRCEILAVKVAPYLD